MLNLPETILRAVAASTYSPVRDMLLGACGYDSTLAPLSGEQAKQSYDSLVAYFEGKDQRQEEIPF